MKTIQQLSIFLENRAGSLREALEILGSNQINVEALSLADTEDFGILRLIVSDPEKGRELLREKGFSASLTDVVELHVSHETGSLSRTMNELLKEYSVEYMYAYANGDDASAIVKLTKLSD